MQQPSSAAARPPLPTPRFYITARQPLRPAAILLAIIAAVCALSSVLYALSHTAHGHLTFLTSRARSEAPTDDDKDEDPNQIDTIVLGDPSDAPVPARKGDHISPVHPTILIRLPRFGDQAGLIPDTPAGRLLYAWLAAFNQASSTAFASVLPTASPTSTAAQLQLRQQTGGFNLLSAKEVQPGLLVFRLRDQTPMATEVLGTLVMRADSSPPAIQSFSLRAVPPARRSVAPDAALPQTASPH